MKATIIIALFAGAAAGTGSAALSGVFMSDDNAGDNISAVDPTDDTDALFVWVSALREQNQDLTDRIQVLESRIAMATTQRVPAAAAPIESSDDLTALAAAPDRPPTQREISRTMLALEKIEADKRTQRDEERRVRDDERLDDQIAKLTEKLGLDAGQAKSMRDILANQNIRRTEMFAGMRNGGGGMDRTNMRDTFRELTESINTQVQNVLSPSQYETYTEDNSNRGFRGFGGGDRGGDRGGDTGGGRRGR